jgi:hypothetical protein
MKPTHPDFPIVSLIVNEILCLSGGNEKLERKFPIIVQEAVDFVLDPVRTARVSIDELDNVEKTFIGLKIEHFLRDYLGVPKGLRDLRIGDLDVDVKNTVRSTWMIPPETFSNEEPCVLVMVATADRKCSLGVFVARQSYLNAANRDKKRSVQSKAFENIFWIIRNQALPNSRFKHVVMERFRELRKQRGGSKRVAQFFRENLGMVFHRNVLLGLLHDQLDPMKRIRGNGGARDILAREGIAVLSGAYDAATIEKFGLPRCERDEFIAAMIGMDAAKSAIKNSKRGAGSLE